VKLLFDQNLSYKLVSLIGIDFPNSIHVRDVALQEEDDLAVWKFAKTNNYTIVTKDIDFYEISLIKGQPPKIIWLRVGNLPTSEIITILQHNIDAILDFHKDSTLSCLDIYRN